MRLGILAWRVERDGRLALVPGAVCGPLDGDARAQRALLERGEDRWHCVSRAVPYDLSVARRAFEESGGLTTAFAGALHLRSYTIAA